MDTDRLVIMTVTFFIATLDQTWERLNFGWESLTHSK